jgi:hypothetical protein
MVVPENLDKFRYLAASSAVSPFRYEISAGIFHDFSA